MPVIFRYKNFQIRIWFRNEEGRRHVHAISADVNIKIWLEPVIEIADIKGHINKTILNELLTEVKRHEQECNDIWDDYV